MGGKILAAFFGMALAFASATGYAQTGDDGMIPHSARVLRFMHATVMEMGKALEKARKSRDTRSAGCVQSRLTDLQKLLAQSEKANLALRDAAFEKKTEVIKLAYNKILRNNRVFEQQIKLVNDCYGNIHTQGGFSESLELYLGEDLPPLREDVGDEPRVNMPEPRPPQYEPEPISASEE